MHKTIKTWGPPILTGVLAALAFPRYHLYPLHWLAFIPLLYTTWHAEPRPTAVRFFVSGWIFYLLLLQWLLTNTYWAGGWGFWGWQALSIFMASYWAAAGALWQWIGRRMPFLPRWFVIAMLWPAMEFLQGWLFTGFGWGSLGYAQGPDLLLLQLAVLGGTPLIAALIIVVNGLLTAALVSSRRRLTLVSGAASVVVLAHGLGFVLLEEPQYDEPKYMVGLVQPDFPLEMKWDPEYSVEMVDNSARKSRLIAENYSLDLIVWPESLIMEPIDRPEIRRIVTDLTRDTGATLYTGSIRGRRNSSYLVTPDGDLSLYYDKIHLAPFGEYVPLSSIVPFISTVIPAIGDMEAGDSALTLPAAGRTLGPLICFEVLFSPMAQALRKQGADVLVVITNLGWFGASTAIPQELEIARVRAVETRLPLIHSANTGITGVFDPWGRFTPISGAADAYGHYLEYRPDIPPEALIMGRWIGALPVAQPAPKPPIDGPFVFAVSATICTVLLTCVAGFAASRKRHPRGDLEQRI